jgi:hypothetical protein
LRSFFLLSMEPVICHLRMSWFTYGWDGTGASGNFRRNFRMHLLTDYFLMFTDQYNTVKTPLSSRSSQALAMVNITVN